MKERADVLLVSRGLAQSRTQAQRLLMAGRVYWGERRIDKAGTLVPTDAELQVREGQRFVSRGGTKLEGALAALQANVEHLVCADIGASTGGFTDCLLQRGAERVYAIDVGRGQLSEKLRADARVVVMEGVNARCLRAADFLEPIDLITVDASFISLEKLLPALADILRKHGHLLALVKPQFEAGRKEASRGRGVIRDPAVREAAIARVRAAVAAAGFEVLGECESQLAGPKGNLERFILAVRS
jgi:23S rRNA (cytidine1920-2'-O)/16S rRNA (cytidine1409-2'-O)-methyltransferase